MSVHINTKTAFLYSVGEITEKTMEDSKESTVNKEDQAAAFSWWWDSHNRPHHSQWLEATLSGSYLFSIQV